MQLPTFQQTASKLELIDLNDYIDFLKPHHKRGYFECPNCNGKFSFRKSDGTNFTCWNGCGDRSAIRKVLLELAGGENNTRTAAEWEKNREAERTARIAQRAKKCLPVDIRDIEYRQIGERFGTLGILYKNDLLRRGLTEEQIEWMQAQGWISNWIANEEVNGHRQLPGIDPGTGKTVWGSDGLAISATTIDGKIAGYQLYPKETAQAMADGEPVQGGKYTWISRDRGNKASLVSGEMPICIRIHPDTKLEQIDRIIFGEGFLKMSIAAVKQWDLGEDLTTIFVGFAGCQMGSAKQQIEEILKAVPNCQKYYLYPDGDACNKEQVFKGYKGLADLIPALQVMWAGVHHKSADIDNIDRANTKITIIPFEKFERIASERRLYLTLNTLGHKVNISRDEEYLSELSIPKGGQITLVSSGCGTGKTEELASLLNKWQQLFPDSRIIDIVHRNSIKLGHQQRLGITDYKVGFGQDDAAINFLPSISICPDSILRLNLESIPPHSIVTIDEIEAVLKHITEGGTLGANTTPVQAHITQIIDRVLMSGGAVIGLEDNITDTSVQALKNLTGNRYPISIVNNIHQKFNWDVTIGCGSNAGFTGLLIDRLKNGESIFLVTSSQKYGEALERLVLEQMPDLAAKRRRNSLYPMLMGLMATNYPVYSLMGWVFPEYAQIVREDSKTLCDTQHILDNPSAFCQGHQIRLFIGSSTIESGFNIDFPLPREDRNCADAGEYKNYDYFDRVMGYFVNLDTRTHIQMLSRVRSNVPRDIYCLAMGAEAGSTRGVTPASIYQVRKQMAVETSLATGNGKIKNNRIGEVWNVIDAQFSARSALSSKYLLSYLKSELLDRGHRVKNANGWNQVRSEYADNSQQDGHQLADYTSRLKKIGLEILEEENDILARADGKALTPMMALAKLHSTGIPFEERQQAIKCLLHHELPGAELSHEFLMECITKDRGRYRREIELTWLAQNVRIAESLDRDLFATQLSQPHILYRRAPKYQKKANLLAVMSPMVNELLDGSYDGEHDAIKRIQEVALQHQDDIWKYFHLTIKPESIDSRGHTTHSTLTTAHKIVRLFGYKVEAGKKLGSDDARRQLYHISNANCPHRQTIYDALERKYADTLSNAGSEPTSITFTHDNLDLKVVDGNLKSIVNPTLEKDIKAGDRVFIPNQGRWGTVIHHPLA